MSAPKLVTCSYKEFTPEMGVPVQISNGRPKFPLNYLLDYKINTLCPARNLMFGNYSKEDFYTYYQRDLDRVGVASIQNAFNFIAENSPQNKPLVLLCFEDLSKPGIFCHRRTFAEWWEKQTGQKVPELGKPEHPNTPPPEPTLF